MNIQSRGVKEKGLQAPYHQPPQFFNFKMCGGGQRIEHTLTMKKIQRSRLPFFVWGDKEKRQATNSFKKVSTVYHNWTGRCKRNPTQTSDIEKSGSFSERQDSLHWVP
jgi:hypothetical protein